MLKVDSVLLLMKKIPHTTSVQVAYIKDKTFINKMNKTDMRCIRSFLSFKSNALWVIVLFIFIYKNSNNKDKLAYIKRINETFNNKNCTFGS